MKSDWNSQITRSVLELERLKQGILRSRSQLEFEAQIQLTIDAAYRALHKLVSRRTELFAIVQRNIQHLKELKESYFLPQSSGQYDALRYQASMALGVLQFSFWEGSNQELYNLLDSAKSQA